MKSETQGERNKTLAKPPGKQTTLTQADKAFADHYLVTLNATESYLTVKPQVKRSTAEANGHRLLRKAQVAEYIAERQKELQKQSGIKAERVIQELARIALFDPRKLFDDTGRPIHISQLDDDTAAAIVGLEAATMGKQGTNHCEILKYKFADKNSAIDKLMRHLGLYEKDNNQSADSLAEALKAARQRVKAARALNNSWHPVHPI